MLVNMNDVLKKAQDQQYAVPAFDTDVSLLLKATVDAAKDMRSPVILQFHEQDLENENIYYVTSLVEGISKHYQIPVVLHLDHGEHPEKIKRAIDHGFTSVMYDGSHLPLDENIRNTKEIVDYAHAHNVSVEGELGHVGGSDLDFNDTGESLLTNPQDVVKFVTETGVDALAVSIGTSHGVYKSEPTLNLDVLREIRKATDVPLVIHGGSGTPPDQLKDAIQEGIVKVNIFADLRLAFKKGLDKASMDISRPDPLPFELYQPIQEQLKEAVKAKIQLLGSENKA